MHSIVEKSPDKIRDHLSMSQITVDSKIDDESGIMLMGAQEYKRRKLLKQ